MKYNEGYTILVRVEIYNKYIKENHANSVWAWWSKAFRSSLFMCPVSRILHHVAPLSVIS